MRVAFALLLHWVAAETLRRCPAATMLTPGILRAYRTGVERAASRPGVETLARGQAGNGYDLAESVLFATDAGCFLADETLMEEIFGASLLLIRCPDSRAMRDVVDHLEGQLTFTLQMDSGDVEDARMLLPTLERKAGPILVNGFPTGVEVCHAMVHGGPFPATSDPRSTSVGSLAIRRFLRPVCYQDFPASLLPPVLRDDNPARIPHRLDGKLSLPNP